MDPNELAVTLKFWKERHYAGRDIDNLIAPLRKVEPLNDWLRRVRRASFWSGAQIGAKMGMSRQAYLQLELAESDGTISLNSIKKCAEALNCELVYGLRPKERRPLSRRIFDPLLIAALNGRQVWHWGSMNWFARANALANAMCRRMEDPRFRRKQGWARY